MINLEKSYDVALAMSGKTREELAHAMDVHYVTACKYARGECVSVKSLEDAGRFFHMSVSDFIKLGES